MVVTQDFFDELLAFVSGGVVGSSISLSVGNLSTKLEGFVELDLVGAVLSVGNISTESPLISIQNYPEMTLNLTADIAFNANYSTNLGYKGPMTASVGQANFQVQLTQNSTMHLVTSFNISEILVDFKTLAVDMNNSFLQSIINIIVNDHSLAVSTFSAIVDPLILGLLNNTNLQYVQLSLFDFNFTAGFAGPTKEERISDDTHLLGSFWLSAIDNMGTLSSPFPMPQQPFFIEIRSDALDLQLGVSSTFLNQIGWLVYSRPGFLHFSISNTTIAGLNKPIEMTTSSLDMFFPGLVAKYGPKKGMYLLLQSTDGTYLPKFEMKDGRLLAILPLGLDVYVDTDGSKYPQPSPLECRTCVRMLESQIQVFLGLYVTSLNGTHVSVDISNIKIISGSLTSSALNLELASVFSEINNFFGGLIPSIEALVYELNVVGLLQSLGLPVSQLKANTMVGGLALELSLDYQGNNSLTNKATSPLL